MTVVTRVVVAPEPLDATEPAALVTAQVRELSRRYDDAGPAPLAAADVAPGHGAFLVARQDGLAVGCGAVRTLEPGVGEVKRMYVVPEARGRGIGAVLLDALVRAGRELGHGRLVLESGTLQPEALALYRRAGWQPIPAYGEFRDDPRTICLGLDLR